MLDSIHNYLFFKFQVLARSNFDDPEDEHQICDSGLVLNVAMFTHNILHPPSSDMAPTRSGEWMFQLGHVVMYLFTLTIDTKCCVWQIKWSLFTDTMFFHIGL